MTVELRRATTDQVVHLAISWHTYASLVESLGDHARSRLTYDGEILEIMSPGPKHERIAAQIDALLTVIVPEWEFNIEGTGSTTFRRLGESGFEADRSYYIENADRVRDRDEINLAVDPPPDLALEVDISSIRDDKRHLCSRIGVPEFWRYRNSRLEAFTLRDGKYIRIDTSLAIPGLPIEEIARRILAPGSRLTIMTNWQNWLRENRGLHESAKRK